MDAQLATRCPHCQTSFRVTMQQLELREGRVRCGACREIFNGIDTVFEYEPGQGFELTPPPAEQDMADRMTLIDFGSLRGTQAPSPANMQAELDALSRAIADLQAKPWATPAASPQEELGSADYRGMAGSHHDDEHDQQRDPAHGLPDIHADDRRSTHHSLRGELLSRGQEDDGGEPAFVQQGRQRERSARRWKLLLWIAVPLLLLALVAQLGFYFRSEIAARSPEAARYLRAACRHIGCTIRLPMQIDQLSLVSSRLDAIGEGNGRFQLVALIRNQGDTVQALPTLDLQMKDAAGEPLVRKAFLPTLYATAEEITKGMPAHSEREVHLLFELAGEAPAGFDLTLFYH
jgi:predicted Zn finger-like uncharacterized protein